MITGNTRHIKNTMAFSVLVLTFEIASAQNYVLKNNTNGTFSILQTVGSTTSGINISGNNITDNTGVAFLKGNGTVNTTNLFYLQGTNQTVLQTPIFNTGFSTNGNATFFGTLVQFNGVRTHTTANGFEAYGGGANQEVTMDNNGSLRTIPPYKATYYIGVAAGSNNYTNVCTIASNSGPQGVRFDNIKIYCTDAAGQANNFDVYNITTGFDGFNSNLWYALRPSYTTFSASVRKTQLEIQLGNSGFSLRVKNVSGDNSPLYADALYIETSPLSTITALPGSGTDATAVGVYQNAQLTIDGKNVKRSDGSVALFTSDLPAGTTSASIANDATVVHLANNETITGGKTFTGNISLSGTGSVVQFSGVNGGIKLQDQSYWTPGYFSDQSFGIDNGGPRNNPTTAASIYLRMYPNGDGSQEHDDIRYNRVTRQLLFGQYAAEKRILTTDDLKGVLPQVVTATQKSAISAPATGLVVYDSTLLALSFYNGTTWKTAITGDSHGNIVMTNKITTADGKDIFKAPNGNWFYIHVANDGSRVADTATVTFDSQGNATVTTP